MADSCLLSIAFIANVLASCASCIRLAWPLPLGWLGAALMMSGVALPVVAACVRVPR